MKKNFTRHSKQRRFGLYRIVFDSVSVKFAVILLFGAFILQPVAPVFANETDEANVAVEETPIEAEVEKAEEVSIASKEDIDLIETEIIEDLTAEKETAEEVSLEGNILETESDTEIENVTVTESMPKASTTVVVSDNVDSNSTTTTENATATATSTEIVASATSSATQSSPTIEATTTQDVATTSESLTPEASEESTPQEDVTITDESDSDSVVTIEKQKVETTTEQELNSDGSTTTEQINGPSIQYSDSKKYKFEEQDCVSVGDGSYYCSDVSKPKTISYENEAYATLDNDGDTEIYLRTNGSVKQITDNTFDDSAPYYDRVSNSVVWQRLSDGRYEILSFNLDDEKEIQITSNDINDMEPARSGEYTVWQQWVTDNWEIVLYDGSDELQITDNSHHDVAPHIRGGYVIWHTNNNQGERQVNVYEIESGLTSHISDSEGGLVENPRFVLVYDTTFDNGDVVTKGYDFTSGEVVPLSSAPAELPEEIPLPDSTGETRALIQNKTVHTKEELVERDPIEPGASGPSTSTQPILDVDVVVVASSSVEAVSTSTVDMMLAEDVPFELTEFDIVVEPYIATSSTQVVDSVSATSSVE